MNELSCFLAELLGTAILILLGNGVVANVKLERSGMQNGNSVHITIGWGLAVMLPAFIFGATSGAHFNPVLTLALAADGSLSWNLVGWYVSGQMLGGALGAVLVWLLYYKHFMAEFVGTFVLVFAIKGIAQTGDLPDGVNNFFVFGIITSIGMSLGGLTGYAINPARDLGPRLMYALLPLGKKDSANWGYAWIPVVAPILGALAAVGLYKVFPWPSM